MSNVQLGSSRAALASAALLSLALLSACQSKDGSEGLKSAGELASTDQQPTTGLPFTSVSEQLVKVGDRVHFELDRYELDAAAQSTLQQQAALLQKHPQFAVTVQGHADERGTREYNLALGERRADSVRSYLIALGIPGDRISVISYGKERPECAGADESCWAQNRRGVTAINQ